jgi:hypothetical protein
VIISPSSYVLSALVGDDLCVCVTVNYEVQKSAMALYLNVVKGGFNQGADKSNHVN